MLLTLSPVYSCPSHLDNPAHPGSAMQNLGQDTCKVHEGLLKSQIRYGQEDFLGATAYFILGAAASKNQNECRNCHADPNPNKPLLQRESSRHRRTPTAQAEAQRGKAKPKSTNSCASSPSENKALLSRLWAHRQPCPEPLPQLRRMRQCKPMSNTAPRASCSQGYHGPCTARCNPQSYLLGYPHPFLRERGLPYYPKSQGDGTSGNHSRCIRHRQLLGTGMVSPTYAHAAPSSHQGAVNNYRNMRDKRVHA